MAENTRRLSTYRNTIPAGGSLVIERMGNFVSCLYATADFTIGIDDAPPCDFGQGLSFVAERGDAFTSVRLENPSGAPVDFWLAVGIGTVLDARATFAGALPVAAASALDTPADVTIATGGTALLLAANGARKTAIIKALLTNAGQVRVGDVNAGAARGLPLDPGESLTLDVSAALYCHNATGADAKFAIAELES